jgi:hypothetical protein
MDTHRITHWLASWRTWIGTLACIVSIATGTVGCSTVRLIDSDVTSFSAPDLPVAVPAAESTSPAATYRFERLPLQGMRFMPDAIERQAIALLGAAGWAHTGETARFTVQIEPQVVRFQPPNTLPGIAIYHSNNDPMHGAVFLRPQMEAPWYRYTVHILVRQISNSSVVFESTAVHEGPWPDVERILPTVVASALQGFPHPPPGRRRVILELAPRPNDFAP